MGWVKVIRNRSAFFNVMDYGAHRDGTTNDVDHIKAAINDAGDAGGGTVYLPAGTYALNDFEAVGDPNFGANLALRDNVNLVGDGSGITILDNIYAYSWCSGLGGDNVSNCTISGLSVLLDPLVHVTDGAGAKHQSCHGWVYNDVYFYGSYIGCTMYGCTDMVLTNVTAVNGIMGLSASDNENDYGTDNITFDGCEVSGMADTGFRVLGNSDTQRASHVTFHNCYAHDNETTGFFSGGPDAPSYGYTYYVTFDGCTASANYDGLTLCYADDYLITGCTVSGNGRNQTVIDGNSNSRG